MGEWRQWVREHINKKLTNTITDYKQCEGRKVLCLSTSFVLVAGARGWTPGCLIQGITLSGAVMQGSKQKWAVSKRSLIPGKDGIPSIPFYSDIRTCRSRSAQNGLNTFLPEALNGQEFLGLLLSCYSLNFELLDHECGVQVYAYVCVCVYLLLEIEGTLISLYPKIPRHL